MEKNSKNSYLNNLSSCLFQIGKQCGSFLVTNDIPKQDNYQLSASNSNENENYYIEKSSINDIIQVRNEKQKQYIGSNINDKNSVKHVQSPFHTDGNDKHYITNKMKTIPVSMQNDFVSSNISKSEKNEQRYVTVDNNRNTLHHLPSFDLLWKKKTKMF